MASIILKNVNKNFGNTVVVVDLNLEITDGEFIVLVGPSGCGKSTTLRMIAGLEEVSSGNIFIGQKDVTHLEPSERNIAMVFQNYALYPHKTVYENLAFGLKMRKVPADEIKKKIKWAAEILRIENLLERKPKQLSGGQMQRVSLGRALVRSPEVFLLDEPLSNLDAKLRIRMREEIGQLHQRIGINMVYVTHDQVEAMTLGDRIVVMNQGKVQQIGTPLEVYDHPVNLFVAGFIGAPEMNLIEGSISEDKGQYLFKSNGLDIMLGKNLKLDLKQADKIVLGIRPEHFEILSVLNSQEPSQNQSIFTAKISMIEQMGAHTLFVCELPSNQKIRILSGREDRCKVGDDLNIALKESKWHIFNGLSGESLI
ncbi:sn-glycerol-3-phosphate ABC transporter ATP-binding protein UgpC [Polynucleobacter sp. IMCC30063]|uniref:ABC transporter ATP-binding protein n=1 Tax=unclassified Polynucleobacter TaxID=2640945 RepID=UPI001F1595DA|nr:MULTISPECIES: sn-glycerol-3-phosphate ABC transporter ATP-binding protein UgpC [unclassified Polynucleobacter]MCE7505486.1 sn-glycerol-3-phosphate ABC transporter ATP-binding protein UgpC [Polynucleobacter sp. IMCC30063]MCE7530352.1 sn-glycerol-3-phosphate ABC transporter ATP-binding protein UgpC [Polynucleobacter sp. IMCC 29146]